jgi:hypothetical protein
METYETLMAKLKALKGKEITEEEHKFQNITQ